MMMLIPGIAIRLLNALNYILWACKEKISKLEMCHAWPSTTCLVNGLIVNQYVVV